VIPELPAVRTERPPNAGPLKRPEPTERADSTVRVIYLAAEEAPSDEARRPAMDLNVALPGEGARRPDARNTAISAMDDAGRLRQSAWPKGNQLSDEVELRTSRPRRDEDVTTEFDTASQAALDLGSLSTQLAETDAMGNDPGMSDANADSKDAPKPAPSKPNAPLKDSVAKPGLNDALVTTGWIGFALLVLTVCLAILARIPTIE
jgi:hypothetical protein